MYAPIDILEDKLLHDKLGLLEVLLKDHTTEKNIFWATGSYKQRGEGYKKQDPITPEAITGDNGDVIRPRAVKAREEQQQRSREMAEVFTPSWLCNEMNNIADEEWFGRRDVFNTVDHDHRWHPQPAPIAMPEGRTWRDYVLTTRLEITCGEAPFLVSRYDTVTGEAIPLDHRIGMLDRKLRIVAENATDEEWPRWALLALGSCYGYEWQGDSLLLAREAVVETFAEYYEQRFDKPIGDDLLEKAAEIVSWNLWQMDGLKGVVPCSCREVREFVPSLFGEPEVKVTPCAGCANDDITKHNGLYCQFRRWLPANGNMPAARSYKYLDIIKNNNKINTNQTMKFDFIIGNPPYQEETDSDSTRKPPVYNLFMDETFKVGEYVELVTPARFLFNAGYTPKAWNEKMLNSKYFRVLKYYNNGSEVFPNTEIKGGVIVSEYSKHKETEPIVIFTIYDELNSILSKVRKSSSESLDKIIYSPLNYGLSDLMKKEHSDLTDRLRSSAFANLSSILYDEKPVDGHEYIEMVGLLNTKRVHKFVRKDYITDRFSILNYYNLLLPKASGDGKFGEILAPTEIAVPGVSYTQTFIAIGRYKEKSCIENIDKYIKTKFARALLGVLKITQDCPAPKWRYVPLQDFTSSSDIDWTKSIHEIDLQLYDKYGLTEEERGFIETHVKTME